MTAKQKRDAARIWIDRAEDSLRKEGALTMGTIEALDLARSMIGVADQVDDDHQEAVRTLRLRSDELANEYGDASSYQVGVVADGLEMYVAQCELQLGLFEGEA